MGKAIDAAHEREKLAHALAAWKTENYWPSDRASWWHLRVRRLARICGLPLDRVMTDLQRDAQMILDEAES